MRLHHIRRQLGLLGIGLLVATGLTTLSTGPAAASVPGWRLVSDTVESDDDDESASVDCGDQWVYGSGFELTGDGGRYVIMDELIPSLHTVTGHAYEYETRTGLDWGLTVWAVCGDPRGSHRTTSRVTTSDPRDYKDVDTTCGDGTSLTGTGWQIEGARGEALVRAVVPDGDTVTAEAYEVQISGGYLLDWSLRVFATCVTAPAGLDVLSASTSEADFNKTGHRDCPAGKVILGGGFDAGGPQGQINNVNLLPTDHSILVPTNHSMQTKAFELVSTTNEWALTTYAICASR